MASNEDTFARLVSLAVHDLRTPLATVSGFARTLQRTDLGNPQNQYLAMMVAASDQLADLLDDLGLAARIESGRWEPNLQEVDTLELAEAAAEPVEGAHASGYGEIVRIDRDAAETALRLLAACAIRHGGISEVTLAVDGAVVALEPVTEAARPILLREQLRDLGAAVAAPIVSALGATIEVQGRRLLVRFVR